MSSHEEWSRAMRAIWLLNTIEVELSHLGIPIMRVPPALRDLHETLRSMSEQDCLLVEDELSRAHASLAQVVDELQASMSEIEQLLHRRADAPVEPPMAAEAITESIGA
jgi:ligand-binding sensor domain-containing protein